MQLQFNKTMIRSLATALQQVRNTEVTQELRLPDGMPDIGRVLTSWGQVVVRSKQWQGDLIQMTGGIIIWVLYAPEDGSEPRSIDSWIPFQINWNLAEATREGPMHMMPLLQFTDSRCISSRKLMLRAGVAAVVHAFSPTETEIYEPGEIPEDVQLLRKTYPMTIPVEGGEKTFLIDDEVNLPDVGSEVQKLLCLTVTSEITEKKIMSEKVVFKGILTLRPVCRYADGQVRVYDLPMQFSQLADLENAYGSEAQVDIRMALTSIESDLMQSGVIRVKCGLIAQYLIENRLLLDIVQDAYSPIRAVQLEESTLQLPVVLDQRIESTQIEQLLPGQSGHIVDIRFLPDYPIKNYCDNGVSFDLSGIFQILSYDEDGILQGATSRWEGNMKLSTDGICDPLVTVKSAEKMQTMSPSDGISVSLHHQLSIWTGKMEKIPMIAGVELGQTRETDTIRPSVILVNGAGESLWDLAKNSNSTISLIRSVNDIIDDTAPDRLILIPVV